MVQNKGLIFKSPPSGWPEVGKHIAVESRDFDTSQAPPSGGLTAKVHWISFDPYQRGRLRDPSIKSYSPAFELGQPINNSAIVSVIKSDAADFKEGDILYVMAGCEEYTVIPKEVVSQARKLHNPHNLLPREFLGALGMPGLTAYSSFYEIGQPKKGETIFISSAAGAVGQIVGQLAKHEGLTVIGSVGDDKKLDFITSDLKFDSGFNYKKESPADALARLAPNGIDIYYENVGGEHLEASIAALNDHGRIVACGMISQYNNEPGQAYGVKNLMQVVAKRLTIRGFIVMDKDFGPKHAKAHNENVSKWIADGSFKTSQHVTKGIDNAAEGLLGIFKGQNFGKAVLEIDPNLPGQ